ncbi:Flagellar protein FlaG [Candidatus Magnetomoraceae bacterium gMMP-1]
MTDKKTSGIPRINKISNVSFQKDLVNTGKKKRKLMSGNQREAETNFKNLLKAVETAYNNPEYKNSPYRFLIYQKDGRDFIDLARVDKHGKIKEIKKKNLTHQEFINMIKQLEKSEG